MFRSNKNSSHSKKKPPPPPRPPPPDFSKLKSKSSYNLTQTAFDLIEWSPPSSPKVERNRPFGGSVSSSFSSSTSSLASSKKGYDSDSMTFIPMTWLAHSQSSNNTAPTQLNNHKANNNTQNQNSITTTTVPSLFGPTIIRAVPLKRSYKKPPSPVVDDEESFSSSPRLPMPSVPPPPSPPKEAAAEVITPYGIALFDFQSTHPSDLPLQVNDVVILLRRINSEWFYGSTGGGREGMFPSSFIDIQVPLPEDEKTAAVTALYDFQPQMSGDLALAAGQKVNVLKKISEEWLYGESNGNVGQFPANFVDRIPSDLD